MKFAAMAAFNQMVYEHEEESCWICMSGKETAELIVPCKCPPSRAVHERCLARWQLQQAGRSEETHCRFCQEPYGDWRTRLTPRIDASIRPPTPIMAISFEGQIHYIKVYPGPEGKKRFEQQIRELIQLQDDEEFDVEFECKAPDSGTTLHLDGINAFDAATHCAALTAAERISKQQQQRAARLAQQQAEAAQLQQQQQEQLQPSPVYSSHMLEHQSSSASGDVQQCQPPFVAAAATTQVQVQGDCDALSCPMSCVYTDRWSNEL